MAKAKSPQKATEAPRGASGESSPQSPGNSGAARSESEEARENAALQEGADVTALLTEVLAKLSKEEAERHRQNLVLKGLTEAVTDVYHKIDEIPKPAAPKKVEELAEQKVKKLQLDGSRVMLWQCERREDEREDSKYHLPRPSIIGRTLHVLGAFSKRQRQTAGPIFQEIQRQGEHHLKTPLITDYLKAYVRADGTKDSNISGKLKEQLEPRLEILLRRCWAEIGEIGCWLTPRGQEMFDGWPDYEVQDDDFECLGELKSASPPAAAKGPASPATSSAAAKGPKA